MDKRSSIGKDKVKTMKWGIIGPGNIAKEFAEDLQYVRSKKCVIGPVLGKDFENTQEFVDTFHGALAAKTIYEFIKAAPDAAYIATPHPLHFTQTMACLENKIPVLCEKPLALNLRQVTALTDASKRNNTFLMEGMWTRFLPSFQFLLNVIKSGTIGEVLHVHADLSFIAGEVREPQRNLPRALIGGTLAVIAIYLLANLAYLTVLPIGEMRHSPLIAAEVGQRLLGAAGAALVSVTVVVSTFGTLNGVLLTTPRIFFAMAADGKLFRPLARVHPRFQTPYVAIGLGAALGVVFVLARTFEQLTDAFVVAIAPFYALGVAAVFRLRRRGTASPFRSPGYPLVPALFVAAMLFLLGNAILDPSTRWATLAVLGVVLAGIPVHALIR